jgi:Uma2 family endonuclease
MARRVQTAARMTSAAILPEMKAVLLEPSPEWLEERRKWGADRWDEVWEGVLHLVSPPKTRHQRFEGALERALSQLAVARGLECFRQLGFFDPKNMDENYRVPDITILRTEDVGERGAMGRAELVIEVLSPHDESREKLPFYAKHRVGEVWIVDPITCVPEIYTLRGTTYFAIAPNRHGVAEAPRLELELKVIDGPKLRISWADGSAEI